MIQEIAIITGASGGIATGRLGSALMQLVLIMGLDGGGRLGDAAIIRAIGLHKRKRIVGVPCHGCCWYQSSRSAPDSGPFPVMTSPAFVAYQDNSLVASFAAHTKQPLAQTDLGQPSHSAWPHYLVGRPALA